MKIVIEKISLRQLDSLSNLYLEIIIKEDLTD